MCRAGPAPGELLGPDSEPYSHEYFEVSGNALWNVPFTYTLMVELIPPPPAESGMENRVTRVFVDARVVNSTYEPFAFSVTARRPEASPARSPIVRFGPTT